MDKMDELRRIQKKIEQQGKLIVQLEQYVNERNKILDRFFWFLPHNRKKLKAIYANIEKIYIEFYQVQPEIDN